MKNYSVFGGRASRTEFWNFMLFWVIFYVFVVAIDKVLGGNYVNFQELPFSNYIPIAKLFDEVGLLTLIYRPLTLLPSLAAISRRLHDINKSGWWCLTCVTPFILVLIFFLCKKSDEGTNKYGIQPT